MTTRKSLTPKIAREHAYHQTRSMLRARRSDMAVKLQRLDNLGQATQPGLRQAL